MHYSTVYRLLFKSYFTLSFIEIYSQLDYMCVKLLRILLHFEAVLVYCAKCNVF